MLKIPLIEIGIGISNKEPLYVVEINAREKFNEIKTGIHLYDEDFYDLKILINDLAKKYAIC